METGIAQAISGLEFRVCRSRLAVSAEFKREFLKLAGPETWRSWEIS